MKITAIIPVFDDSEKLKISLESLKFADEKIVIDNGSTDQSVSVAKKNNAQVFYFKGTDFAAMRDIGSKKAKHEWLLFIDADEIVTPELASEIKNIPDGFSAFSLERKNYFYGKAWPKEEKIVRLIKKSALKGWNGKVHETVNVEGRVGNLINPILHYTHDDIAHMVNKTNLWSEIEADLRFQNRHPKITVFRLLRVMITGFWDSYILQKGYKKGIYGFIEATYQSFSFFITFAKLWEKQSKKS